ncbi:MAG: DEAD/DEAH box helicase [Pirellulaceae bacterium]|nr:DEAD/DEAH box helicase [Pirellulaceae bacterium]
MRNLTVDLELRASLVATGWQTALFRKPSISLSSPAVQISIPDVVSIPFGSHSIPVRSFDFGDEGDVSSTAPRTGKRKLSGLATKTPLLPQARGNSTRLQAPHDVIKLKDRLFYALQPPLETIFSSKSLEFPFPPFPYQMEGVAFLFTRQAAMLADEMGLGKTMQAITSIRLMAYSGDLKNVLLICPKPLVTNWQREFQLWAPELPVTIIEGNGRKREWLWSMPEQPIKIANYELVVRDAPFLKENDLEFDLVVLDEAQRIKNRSSATNRAVRSIQRKRSWSLTGTPIENSADDLFNIFEFLRPGVLRGELTPRRLRLATQDYLLRRTKDQVLDELPPKLFRDAQLSLSSAQHQSYTLAEKEGVVRLAGLGGEVTVQHVFELVLRLKQICNFDPATEESPKLDRLQADLEEVAASGAKAIVFSQWVRTLRRLKKRLHAYHPLEYHGKIPHRDRDKVLTAFRDNSEHQVLLMTYGAGSVGLNLQFANYVFLFDRWWNPAVEDQAINRAHRIGVAGPVTVTRFITLGTIEERIDEILQQKRELFETVLADRESPPSLGLSQDEIFGLFSLPNPISGQHAA